MQIISGLVVMGRKSKILKLGWPAEAMTQSLNSQGKSLREIAEELSERFDEDVSHESVKNYLNNHSQDKYARMSDENRGYLEQEKVERIMDAQDWLEKIDDKLETMMDNLSETDKNDYGQILQVMREIRQQMKFQKEYLEEVSSPNTEINNYEVNNTAIQISEKLMEYEDEGIIEIKKPHKLTK